MAEKKSFTQCNPNANLSNKVEEPPVTSEPKQSEPESERKKEPTNQKRKIGRPTTKNVKENCRTISVAVPITLLDKWEDIKIIHGSNLTGYITKLIEKDMDANYERYKNILNDLKNI